MYPRRAVKSDNLLYSPPHSFSRGLREFRRIYRETIDAISLREDTV